MKTQNEKLDADKNDTVLIVNRSSSSGSTGKNWDDFYIKVKSIFGENPEVAFTKKSGDGSILAREYLRKGFKYIIAIGGDGTINEVANGFFFFNEDKKEKASVGDSHNPAKPKPPTLRRINPAAVFGIVPSGTRNVLAKSLNLPTEDLECCQRFVDGKVQKIDVISATVTNSSNENGSITTVTPRIFLNAAEIGIGAEIIDRSKKIKDKVKNRIVSTISSVVATLPTYQSTYAKFL